MKIFNARGDLVYSDDRKLIGRNDIELGQPARGARRRVRLRDRARHRRQRPRPPGARGLHPAVARLRRRGRRGARGLLSYDAVAAAIGREKRTLYLFLGIGLRAALRGAVPDRRSRLAAAAPPRPPRRPHRPAEPHALPRARRARDRGRAAGAPGRACCSSTSTASRRSTTRSGTTTATSCCEVGRAAERRAARGRHAGPPRRRRVRGRCSPDLPDRGAAAEAAGRLQRRARRPFGLRRDRGRLDASVGIALAPEHGADRRRR